MSCPRELLWRFWCRRSSHGKGPDLIIQIPIPRALDEGRFQNATGPIDHNAYHALSLNTTHFGRTRIALVPLYPAAQLCRIAGADPAGPRAACLVGRAAISSYGSLLRIPGRPRSFALRQMPCDLRKRSVFSGRHAYLLVPELLQSWALGLTRARLPARLLS